MCSRLAINHRTIEIFHLYLIAYVFSISEYDANSANHNTQMHSSIASICRIFPLNAANLIAQFGCFRLFSNNKTTTKYCVSFIWRVCLDLWVRFQRHVEPFIPELSPKISKFLSKSDLRLILGYLNTFKYLSTTLKTDKNKFPKPSTKADESSTTVFLFVWRQQRSCFELVGTRTISWQPTHAHTLAFKQTSE